jgi:RNA polymerase sigma-70 factor, ECF subfamily
VRDDDQLVVGARSGDEAAFAALVERHQRGLVRVAMSIVGRRDLADEVVQDTWLAALRGLDSFAQRASFKTWLYRICINRARSTLTREGRAVLIDPHDEAVESHWFAPDGAWSTPVQPWPDTVVDRLAATQLAGEVRRTIDHLPDSQRVVVTLRDVEGLTSSDVCQLLDITEANQRVLLHRGRNRIRAALDDRVLER